ncbi:MAG TPA: haloacid dehalogenase [Dehalococcoidia bacterium]|nr:haloacid dehalogenase [Dehalococcoidia bacterium]
MAEPVAADGLAPQLDRIMAGVRENLVAKHAARERALPLCREVIRLSANGIRATHRDEFSRARELLGQATTLLRQIREALEGHADIFFAGFVHDAQKEHAEAALTLALVAGEPLPAPAELAVEHAAYLNGMGEAVGELRRYLLDSLRDGDIARCERFLRAMDDIYDVLVTVDYPDALTGGLRRTTDVTRGILERTRGDLTTAALQTRLEGRLAAFEARLLGPPSPDPFPQF